MCAAPSKCTARASSNKVKVSLAWSPRSGEAEELTLSLPAGATALDALRAGGLLDGRHDGAEGADPSSHAIGIWGRACTSAAALKEGDRVELYRPLALDPKEARRQRATRR